MATTPEKGRSVILVGVDNILSAPTESIGLFDANGIRLRPKFGYRSHFTTKKINTDFFRHVKEVAEKPITEETLLSRTKESLAILYDPGSWRNIDGLLLPPQLHAWDFLYSDTPDEYAPPGDDAPKDPDDEFYDNYDHSERDRDVVIQFSKQAKGSYVSSIPARAWKRFRHEMADDWKHLDRIAAILNPDSEIVSGIHTKLTMAILRGRKDMNISSGSGSSLIVRQGRNVFLRDDDLAILLWGTAALNIKGYLGVPWSEAEWQSHLEEFGNVPHYLAENGQIVEDVDGSKMLEDMINPDFKNIPEVMV